MVLPFRDLCAYRQSSIYSWSYVIFSNSGNGVPSALVQSSGMSCPAAPGVLREQNQARSFAAETLELVVNMWWIPNILQLKTIKLISKSSPAEFITIIVPAITILKAVELHGFISKSFSYQNYIKTWFIYS